MVVSRAEIERARAARSRTLPVAQRVGRSLARLARLIEQTTAGSGLTLAQFRVLVLVGDAPQRASHLADKVEVQRATLSSIVAGLERSGLIERRAVVSDGRGVQLQLTDAGRSTLASAEEALGARLSRALAEGEVDAGVLADQLEGLLVGFAVVAGETQA